MDIPRRPHFIHHNRSAVTEGLREIVFGAEDGMVSTLGALTGIAAGTENGAIVILAGLVLICVEAVSMGVGSYVSNKSTQRVHERMLHEERIELREIPQEEEAELLEMYERDGWPQELARKMAEAASKNEELFLKEMAYRELGIVPGESGNPLRDGMFMFASYVIGGSVPIIPYLVLPVAQAVIVSIVVTLTGLFGLGAMTTRFTKQSLLKAGVEMLILASTAALIGYLVGIAADAYLSV